LRTALTKKWATTCDLRQQCADSSDVGNERACAQALIATQRRQPSNAYSTRYESPHNQVQPMPLQNLTMKNLFTHTMTNLYRTLLTQLEMAA
jgi:hypothetical protein